MIEALIKRSQGRMYRGYARVFVRAHGDASDYPHELAFLSSVVINEEPTEYEDSFGQPHVVEVRSECLLRFHQFGTHERSFFYDEAVRKPMDYRVAFYAKALEKDAMLLREYENQYASAKAVQENSPYYEVRLSGLFTPLEAESLFEEFSTPELPDIESPLFDEILPPTTLYPTIQVLSDDGAMLTVRIFDDNGLVEEFVDLPPSSGLLLPNGRRRFNLTMTQSVSNGSRYRIVAFSRRLNRRSLERESPFRSGIAVPELSYSSPHVYINSLPVTLSLVTNATQYQLRWRRIGAPSWNEFLPQPPSNRTFTIPPSALDDALIVSFGIEVQGRAFNDVVSSAWSAPQTIEIIEPAFSFASSVASSSPWQSGKHEKLRTYNFTVNLTRSLPFDNSPILINVVPNANFDVVSVPSQTTGSSFSGQIRVRGDSALGLLVQQFSLTSKHGSISVVATVNFDVIELLPLVRVAADVKFFNNASLGDLISPAAPSNNQQVVQIKNLGVLGGNFDQPIVSRRVRIRTDNLVPTTSIPTNVFFNDSTSLQEYVLSLPQTMPSGYYSLCVGLRVSDSTSIAFAPRLLGSLFEWVGISSGRMNIQRSVIFAKLFENHSSSDWRMFNSANPLARTGLSTSQLATDNLFFTIGFICFFMPSSFSSISIFSSNSLVSEEGQKIFFFEIFEGNVFAELDGRAMFQENYRLMLDRIGLNSQRSLLVL